MYTIDLFYMLANVSALVPVKWFLGQYLAQLECSLLTTPLLPEARPALQRHLHLPPRDRRIWTGHPGR